MKHLNLIFALVLALSMLSTRAQNSRETDSLALVALYNATGGENWKNNNNWLSDKPLDEWFGIKMTKTNKRVECVLLSDNRLKGVLPDEITQLDSAIRIIMRYNCLSGTIPDLHLIPHYDSLLQDYYAVKNEIAYTPFFSLSDNCYQFGDIAINPVAYEDSWSGEYIPESVYTQIENSWPFSVDTAIVVAEGDAVELAFDYVAYEDVFFVWSNGTVRDTVDSPIYKINSFDESQHSGDWLCEIFRHTIIPNRKDFIPRQRSGYFTLKKQSTTNVSPQILIKKSITELKKYEKENEYIVMKGEMYPNLDVSVIDDGIEKEVELHVVKKPKHVQLMLLNRNVKSVNLRYEEIEFEDFLIGDKFDGSGFIVKAKAPETWNGIDSLVLKAVDIQGEESFATFYFRSIEDIRELQVPQLTDGDFMITGSDGNFEILWGELPYTDELDIELLIRPFKDDCSNDYLNRITTIQTFDVEEGKAFIQAPSVLPEGDSEFECTIMPRNSNGLGNFFGYDYIINDDIMQKYDKPVIDTLFYKKTNTLLVKFSTDHKCGAVLHVKEDGELVSKVYNCNMVYFPVYVKKDVNYEIFYLDKRGLYSTDTVYFSISEDDHVKPSFKMSNEISLQCEKVIPKYDLVEDVYFIESSYEFGTSPHFTITEEGTDNKDLRIKNTAGAWTGSDTVRFSVTNIVGASLDTFLVVTYEEPEPIVFNADTAKIQTSGIKTPLMLEDWLEDSERILDDLEISCYDNIGDMLIVPTYRGLAFWHRNLLAGTYTDTMTVKAYYDGCEENSDSIVYVYSYSVKPDPSNAPPEFIDTEELTMNKLKNLETLQYPSPNEFVGGYFYKNMPETFPSVNLYDYVSDDGPVSQLTFTWEEKFDLQGKSLTEGVQVELNEGVLSLLPLKDKFYGFASVNDFGDINVATFSFTVIVSDARGAEDKLNIDIGISEYPFSNAVEETVHLCKDEKVKIDLFDGCIYTEEDVKEWIKGVSINKRPAIDTMLISPGQLLVWGNEYNAFTSEITLGYSVILKNSFNSKSSSFSRDFKIISHPQYCDFAPQLDALPAQVISRDKTAELSLWNHVEDNQPASSLFWEFSGGENLNYEYNFDTGKFTAQLKDPNWEGKDTVIVTVEDVYGKKTSTEIVFTTQKPIKTELTETACGSFDYNGDILTESKEYTYTFKAENGADSIVVLDLTVYPEFETADSKTVAFGETYQFGTQELTKLGTYTETFKTVNGCDSTVTLDFTVLDPETIKTELTETACGSFDYKGDILTESKEYSYTFKAANGADSVVILDLTVYPEFETTDSKTVAFGETYQFGAQELSESGTYIEVFESTHGCDSTVTLDFTVLDPETIKTELTETACGSFEYNGDVLTESKEYTYTFKAVSGADSIVALDLTVYPEYQIEDSKTVAYGETFQFGTQELSESGTYTEVFESTHGCDSTATLDFTVLDPETVKTELTETACGSFDYNGDILTESKEYTYTFKAVSGADSIVVLDLMVYPEYERTDSKTVAFGETYQFGTQELSESGTYTEVFESTHGCDSTVTLDFTVPNYIVFVVRCLFPFKDPAINKLASQFL